MDRPGARSVLRANDSTRCCYRRRSTHRTCLLARFTSHEVTWETHSSVRQKSTSSTCAPFLGVATVLEPQHSDRQNIQIRPRAPSLPSPGEVKHLVRLPWRTLWVDQSSMETSTMRVSCPRCRFETQLRSGTSACPRCGSILQSVARMRLLGWFFLSIGLSFAIGATILIIRTAQIISRSDAPEAITRFNGNAVDAAVIFGTFGVLLLWGITIVVMGVWQVRYGTANWNLGRMFFFLSALLALIAIVVPRFI